MQSPDQQSPDQANQPSLIHDDIGEGGQLVIINQYFNMSFHFSKSAQPAVIQLTTNFDLISILRIQTNGLRHIRSLTEAHARPRTSPRIRNRKNTLCPECKIMENQLLWKRLLEKVNIKLDIIVSKMPQGW
jgi:hypothetical protein